MTYGGHDPMRIEGDEYIRRLKEDGVVAKVLSIHRRSRFLFDGWRTGRWEKCYDEVATTLKTRFNSAPTALQ